MLIKRVITDIEDKEECIIYRLNGVRVYVAKYGSTLHTDEGMDDLDNIPVLKEFVMKLVQDPHGNIKVTNPVILEFLKRTRCL